ncbi:MAG: copper resistance protein B [Rhodospirillales bacterium]|nr:copper resistance protein B [Rhodospirillales bacterium]MBT4626332.1 copper resistance protein B [Rhodospirillales bacterium]MBT5352955.1 copper resistance protein B [Rhodospirillales bacterium]MBT6825988.1 copper resistance protein B [Rhodospirillales bacterium]MBT7506146.1 copper resistance protein B [Rhodospirillales bacterium]
MTNINTSRIYRSSILGLAVITAALLAPAPSSAEELGMTFYGIQLEEFEYRKGDENENLAVWDGDAFYGTDEFKLRWISEGEYDTDASSFETLENQLVGQVPISDFFDAKAGVRADTPKSVDRWYGVLGIAGLAPQWFEVDASLFISEEGDASARLDVEYELLLTNRLILTPSAELNVAFSEDTEIGVGSGVSSGEVGLRLSYDVIDRLFSPYVGIVHEQTFGNTKDLAESEGEDTSSWLAVIGTKVVF